LTIDSLLQPFQRFGIDLGLDRINHLLANLGNPHHQVPIIHVAGTNGKGSVCAYLSAILTESGYRVGRYTSPHLVNWTERICLNEKPISLDVFEDILQQVIRAINPDQETPTLFEVVTAAAWLFFAQNQVDIAVIEVGLGGRLDATNVCDDPLVTIITSISREHWQSLGSTLTAIAGEKAGILKPNCPAVIGELPPEAEAVVKHKIETLNCPEYWVKPAVQIGQNWAKLEFNNQVFEYPLPLLGNVQLMNSALAISAIQILREKGWQISLETIQNGIAKTQWLGRLQWVKWQGHNLLIDGAHNPASAKVLRDYIDTLETQIIWVMGILSTKDHREIFEALLRPEDQLYLVPVPDHSTADPNYLASLAENICPELVNCQTFSDLLEALNQVFTVDQSSQNKTVVLCGSLYLIGYFLSLNG
jgi:dihydrofolate synthase / folylpolyglutamate synthase